MKDTLIAIVERPLNAAEVLVAREEGLGSKAPALVRLHSRHHRLARLLAEGFSEGEAGLACGYVSSRVSILQADPSFSSLVDFYRKQVNEKFLDFQEKLADLASTAVDLIQDRLETEGDEIELDDLRKIVQLGADRTGYGPSSTQNTNINVGFGARMEAARQRLNSHKAPDVIEGEIVEGIDDE